MSFWQRISRDASDAANDVYSHWVLGDDAGKSALVTLYYTPSTTSSLGLTFLEINGRAYVKSVIPYSTADLAGVLPQDAVQLAVPVRAEQLDAANRARAKKQEKEVDKEEEDTIFDLDTTGGGGADPQQQELARRYALHLESKGARTTYDQLLRLVSSSVLQGNANAIQQHFLSQPVGNSNTNYSSKIMDRNNMNAWNGPSIPSTICAPIMSGMNETCTDSLSSTNSNNNKIQYSNFERRRRSDSSCSDSTAHLNQPQPILFVFRRTRQRQSTESASSCFVLPASFRLDDECDLACSLVRRLAPTADMEAPVPDTWEELVHDGTDWLLGKHSMLPPKGGHDEVTTTTTMVSGLPMTPQQQQQQQQQQADQQDSCTNTIPLDDFERVRALKLATLRSRITAEAMLVDRTEDVEAATVRAMIQKAVGLAFVRASKVVLGVSIHGGSGIVISRLSDGTWSAPSAIGTWGLGFGLQFGLEVAEYIFILQTQEAMQHFRRGGSYTVGGNMGVAVGGLGREAYGAASVAGGFCGSDTSSANAALHDDEYNDKNDDSRDEGKGHRPPQSLAIAPIVAYAKSQGLYVGVSLEGSRIFTRNDINCRTYKFASGRNVTANDILSGKVPTPPEAEELYAALHSVEFTHEMSCLPRPPEVLRKDSANAWTYDRSTLAESVNHSSSDILPAPQRQQPFAFFSKLTTREAEECDAFEAQFKNFMYGGVSVQRLITDTEGRSDRTGKERRTLWLMLPEVGSLRLGFVSKLSDGEGSVSNKSSTLRARRDDPSRAPSAALDGDLGTVGSEELTLDSALQTKDGSAIGPIRRGNVQLSFKHSVALTDVTVLSQEPLVPIKFTGKDKTQHLRVISIQDVSGASLLFLANNFREAELLVCGLKLLLERETARLGVRGGLPITALGGRNKEGAMSPAAARGFREVPTNAHARTQKQAPVTKSLATGTKGGKSPSIEAEARDGRIKWSKWGKQPGRDYMRGQAATVAETDESGINEQGVPLYVHGQPIVNGIAKNFRLPLPLPLCRVLLLDSTSPVIIQWQYDRGDKNFDQSRWTFPPATPRELERHSSEHQLIASGSMCGAHRTSSFDRPRYGSSVRLSETYSVDCDDPKKVSITVTEKNPRRGFSLRVRIVLRACKDNTCSASVVADVRPVGKDMSNQAGVHKAFLLVLDEITLRYGTEKSGLLAGFLSVVDEMATGHTKSIKLQQSSRPFRHTDPHADEKKSDQRSTIVRMDSGNESSGLVSFEDMLKTGRESPEVGPNDRPETPSLQLHVPEPNPAQRLSNITSPISELDDFVAPNELISAFAETKNDSVLIEVKPLPKIRLSLMPSPREEDEEENSSSSSPITRKQDKKKKKKSSSKSSSRRSITSSRMSSGSLKRR